MSVCLLQADNYIRTTAWMKLIFGTEVTVIKWNLGISKNKDTSLWNIVTISGFRQISLWHINHPKCYQLSSAVIPLLIHICIQHGGRDTVHRMGFSAAAETYLTRVAG